MEEIHQKMEMCGIFVLNIVRMEKCIQAKQIKKSFWKMVFNCKN